MWNGGQEQQNLFHQIINQGKQSDVSASADSSKEFSILLIQQVI